MARSAVPVDRACGAAQRRTARAVAESSMPTMIWSAGHDVFLLLARTPLSFQPLSGFVQGCWSPAQRDLVPVRPTYTPLSFANGPFADGRTARDRSQLTWLTLTCQSGKITWQQSPAGHPSHVLDRRWHPALSRGSDEPCPAAVVERSVHPGEKVYGFAPNKARQGKSGDDIGRRLRRWPPHQSSHPSARRRATRVGCAGANGSLKVAVPHVHDDPSRVSLRRVQP
jgi:hypothetical protein